MALIADLYSATEISDRLAQRFQELRLRKNISRGNLAARSGVTEASIKRFETTGQISLCSIIKLAQVLGVANEFAGLLSSVQPSSIAELKELERNADRQRGRS